MSILAPCLNPCSCATTVPTSRDWLHEIKYDGYRLRLKRDGDRVRLITRGGYNWTDQHPWIAEAASKNRVKRFVIDGVAVVLGVEGIADFNALLSLKSMRRHWRSRTPLTPRSGLLVSRLHPERT